MANSVDLVPRILERIQESITRVEGSIQELRADGKADKAEISKRLDALRQAINGESVLGRLMANDVEDRLAAIEQRLTMIEERDRAT